MKYKKITTNILFFVLPVLILGLFRSEWVTSLAILIFMAINFIWYEYEQNEWKVFLFGVIIGIVAEVGGDLIYKLQYWEQGSFFGIPFWLPLLWGYGFVFIRRLGNSVVKQPKRKKRKH